MKEITRLLWAIIWFLSSISAGYKWGDAPQGILQWFSILMAMAYVIASCFADDEK